MELFLFISAPEQYESEQPADLEISYTSSEFGLYSVINETGASRSFVCLYFFFQKVNMEKCISDSYLIKNFDPAFQWS